MKVSLLKNKNYLKLLAASVITRFGDALDSVALSWLVYILTGSKILMGLLFAVSFIPNIIFLPFAGVLADLGSRKHITIIGDIGRGVSVSCIGILFYLEYLQVWHLFVFIIINSLFESFANPSRSALLPSILHEDQYTSGSSYLTSASTFGDLIGLGLAGVIIAIVGVWGAILIDGITFFLAAAIMSMLKVKETSARKKGERTTLGTFLSMIKEGFDYIRNKKLLLSIVFLGAFLNFSFVPFNVLRPVYVDEILKTGVEGMSYLGIGLVIGIMVGGILAGKIGDKLHPILAISMGLALMGFNYALLGVAAYLNFSIITPLIYATIISFFFGFFLPLAQAPIRALMLRNTEREKLGRISSIFGLISLSATPIGGALVGFIGEYIPVHFLFIIMGLAGFLVSIIFGVKNYSKVGELAV